MSTQYKDSQNADVDLKIHKMLKELPDFCTDYYKEYHKSFRPLTTYRYFQRLRFFFRWLILYDYHNGSIKEITVDELSQLQRKVFIDFLYHIDIYGARSETEYNELISKNKTPAQSTVATRNNYLSALKSLYRFFCDNLLIDPNSVPAVFNVRGAKLTKTKPTVLNDRQQEQIVDVIEYGSEKISNHQEVHRKITSTRDMAIFVIGTHTGLRVAEIAGINLEDIHFQEHKMSGVYRKRNKIDTIYMDDTVEQAIKDWLITRSTLHVSNDERALFVSTQGPKKGARLSVRSIENLVKKYATIAAPDTDRPITPHKLRATCATNIIKKTGDLNYAKEVLSHTNVETTIHYLNEGDEKKEKFRNLLK